MTEWTCPDCGTTVSGLVSPGDVQLAKDLHDPCDWGFGIDVARSPQK